MILLEIRKGDAITINGVTGTVAGIDNSTDRAVFLDLEATK